MSGVDTCDDDGPCGFHAENPEREREPCGRGGETYRERVLAAVRRYEEAAARLRDEYRRRTGRDLR